MEKEILFRLHRGGFEESMKTVVSIKSKLELIEFLKKEVHYQIDKVQFSAEYKMDFRNNWKTHTVTARFPDGFFRVVGQSSGVFNSESENKSRKPLYLNCWQRQHIIHGTTFGACLKLNVELKKTMRVIFKELYLHQIICWLNKKLCSTKYF